MGYAMWQDVGSGAIAGAGAGSVFGPAGAAVGGGIGALGGLFSGAEKERRNKEGKEYADAQMGDARQQTLMALAEKKKKQIWQMQFQESMRNQLLGSTHK
jgi:hypothetical protein